MIPTQSSLCASTVTGNLNVTAKGVTDTGTLVVTGTTTISSATFDVVLDDAANNFTGAVSVTAKDVTLVDTDAIILGASTVTGNLNVTAKGVTDTGTLVVTVRPRSRQPPSTWYSMMQPTTSPVLYR